MSAFAFSLPTPLPRPEVHGHRGCRGLYPENTIPAFLHALQLGVDVLELDVVISLDQQVVVSHEPWLAAHLGTGPAGELIDPQQEQKFNLYQLPYPLIRRCLVGQEPHPEFPRQQPVPSYRPLLREVLQATEAACRQAGRAAVGYSVELKSTPAGDAIYHPQPTRFVELVLAELDAAGVLARTTLLSFDQRILQATRRLLPTQPLCLLSEEPTLGASLFGQLGFVPETFGPDFQLLSTRLVQQLAAHYPTLRIVPWTVNTVPDIQQAITWRVAGITTDYPDVLLSLLV
ncbi:glycerophosphodiester phosphodiesterase family protein [Hymenobacter psoromatis]|uniref:glycerophosphodiester phosphodiesterase family protein n=1 Tax=Hymenobacter psoromatis TaxID=1484116 RepID=UPI001CBFE0A2|nr:glycerophosphodiester phosphodiesterase family protein [Hymenobacter psoromatis]